MRQIFLFHQGREKRLLLFAGVIAISVLLQCFIVRPSNAAGTMIGTVLTLHKTVSVARRGRSLPLRQGDQVFRGDRIETGTAARLEIGFIDETRLYLGERTRVDLDDFDIAPASRSGKLFFDILNGAFRLVTGRIGKADRADVVVRTPFAHIGVRGTDFFAGPALGQYGVLLLKGEIEVFNTAGRRRLTGEGTGVNLIAEDVPPSPVVPWGAARAQAALASVQPQP
ncbi:FecR family protein [Sneathiella chinensis]|uniref:FecR protein domain-containing protein n=1 Tax=Sneathiella chinensis TaxID=349750 RepID=A0ABQ5U3T4_9PROT|nr:FecR family protein [Sneathiella chinensis]GLQ05898.1 hypothetical protein GCM10007924_11190 [Sneathiella chinensis]